jgi:hypothetical protein
MFKKIFPILLSIILIGCIPSAQEAKTKANSIAAVHGMAERTIPTKYFQLQTYLKYNSDTAPLRVYIEGDGRAFTSHGGVSSDPTPRDGLVMKLISRDQHPNILYLARPCQYTITEKEGDPICYSEAWDEQQIAKTATPDMSKKFIDRLMKIKQRYYWSDGRFHEHVIISMDEAIAQVVTKYKISEIELVGYSGGGAIVMLVTPRLLGRGVKVKSIRTIAGNLDHEAITRNYGKRVCKIEEDNNLTDEVKAIFDNHEKIIQLEKIIARGIDIHLFCSKELNKNFPINSQEICNINPPLNQEIIHNLNDQKFSKAIGSLRPKDIASHLKDIPQNHFVSAEDRIVPPCIAQWFILNFLHSPHVQVVEMKSMIQAGWGSKIDDRGRKISPQVPTHEKGWVELWPEMLLKDFL